MFNKKKDKFVVYSVFFIYILFLITGSLRKWFLPDLATPLIFLTDPFVMGLYGYCFFNNLIMYRGLASTWLKLAIFTTIFGLIQYMSNGYALEGWVLGVRAYWLYMPLAFIIAQTFQHQDVIRFFKFNLWLAMPYAILVSYQYRSSPFAFINRGVGGDEEAAVSVALNILRPFGLFTYTNPNVVFTTAMITMLVAVYLAGKKEHPHPLVFLVMALSVSTMGVLTGSRGIYFFVALIIGLSTLGLVATQLNFKTLIKLFFIVAFIALAGLILVNVFPDMYVALGIRIETAAASEGSIWNRAYDVSFSFLNTLDIAPIFGNGIGAGASGVARFLGLQNLAFGESDTERNLNELGIIMGSTFILMRWFTSFWIVKSSIKLARQGKESMLLPLAGFIALNFSVGQLTFSPTISFFPWIFLGMTLVYQNSILLNGNRFLRLVSILDDSKVQSFRRNL